MVVDSTLRLFGRGGETDASLVSASLLVALFAVIFNNLCTKRATLETLSNAQDLSKSPFFLSTIHGGTVLMTLPPAIALGPKA